MKQYILSFTGAGRVAAALCREFYGNDYIIRQVISTSPQRGRELAASCGAEWNDMPEFTGDTDLIIVAVPDHNLEEVLMTIKCPENTIVAHTAGSIGLDVFPRRLKHTGVIYPLQSFSFGRKIDFRSVPFFIEASDDYSCTLLRSVAGSVGGSVNISDTDHRRMLHLAAVFVCNFTNHLLTSGKDIAEKAGFSFDVLKPLITETLLKAMELGPENSQTGPAARNDLLTIRSHSELLENSEQLLNIYKTMTEAIVKYYKNT